MKNLVKEIITSRMTLRKFKISDAADFQAMLSRNKEYMLPWIPWVVNEPETVYKKKEKLREWNGQFLLDQTYSYGIFIKDKLIGFCNMFTRQGKDKLEIGYFIDQHESGQGYATECTYALTKLGFEHIGINKLVLHMSPKNEASVQIPKKLNYKIESIKNVFDKENKGIKQEIMIWAMQIADFNVLEKYEPVSFVKEDGW